MGRPPARPRADCPGCGYRHKVDRFGTILHHDHPSGGACSGAGFTPDQQPETPKGPGPNTEGRVTMSDGITFIPWPKVARLANETMVVTEKLDGTNACIQFQPLPEDPAAVPWDNVNRLHLPNGESPLFVAQSRNRLITPTSDNHGFAAWAYENAASLFADLGYGVHFGEWWGAGLQRRYDMPHKVFSLFNTHRWSENARAGWTTPNLDVVPLLWTGPVDIGMLINAEYELRGMGSQATAPYTGNMFSNPEGVVAYLTATGVSWKITDAPAPKGPKDRDGNAGV